MAKTNCNHQLCRSEFLWRLRYSRGGVNREEYIQALRDIDYKGFLTIEREVGENPAADIASAAKFLKNILPHTPETRPANALTV